VTLWITVEVAPGTSIEDAAIEASGVAIRLGLGAVRFDFNGCNLMAFPGNSQQAVAEYYAWLRRPSRPTTEGQ
jgi:hypothetical protein